MFISGQFRAKALEYGNLAGTSANTNEKHEYQKLQQRFAELADNEEWLADHQKQTLHVADIEYSATLSLRRRSPFCTTSTPTTFASRRKRSVFCDVSGRP